MMPGPPSQAPPSFINKPARGWLHPDHLFDRDGITYAVRYIGCMEVTTSMKVLDFDTRSAIAKECISRVCEDANMKGVERRRPVDRGVSAMLGEAPVLVRAGTNVQLTITSVCLRLSDLDNGAIIHQHEMPNISFASGGDSDTLDYIAYVAKESAGASQSHSGPPVPARACYVLECGGGLAQDVITTIGQAFELRFKEFLKRTPPNRPPPLPLIARHPPLHPDDPEYYNDLPGQAPPSNTGSSSSNLIDLSTELPGARGEAEYINSQVPDQRHKSHHDPFDMSPFALAPPGGGIPSPVTPTPVQTPAHRAQLAKEDWFHGPIPRKDAEAKLRNDGDFLVRESQGSPGQYVLTGMQQGSVRKHLLLVDPQGVVRTKDRAFDNVSHLINFHRHNNLPIISAESALRLQHPVVKSKH